MVSSSEQWLDNLHLKRPLMDSKHNEDDDDCIEKSNSAPSTPRRMDPPNGRRSIVNSPHRNIPKQVPNYLRPTISSSHHTTCTYPKNHQQQQSQPDASGPRLPSKTPPHKASPPHRPAVSKEPDHSEKASKTSPPPPNGKAAPPAAAPIRKTRSLPVKSGEAKPDAGEGKHSKGGSEDCAGAVLEGAAKKLRTRAKSMSMGSIDMGAGPRKVDLRRAGKKVAAGRDGKEQAHGERMKPKKREGKAGAAAKEEGKARTTESPPAHDEEEELAKKLAARRNKVKALVGAFETVISMREVEQLSPQHQNEEVTAAAAAAAKGGGVDARDCQRDEGQPGQRGEGEESKDDGALEEGEEEEDEGKEEDDEKEADDAIKG